MHEALLAGIVLLAVVIRLGVVIADDDYAPATMRSVTTGARSRSRTGTAIRFRATQSKAAPSRPARSGLPYVLGAT